MKLTETTVKLIRDGNRQAAIDHHNATVKRQFDKAKNGDIINLTDLMASAEEIHANEATNPSKPKNSQGE
jgi:hypothetical protein